MNKMTQRTVIWIINIMSNHQYSRHCIICDTKQSYAFFEVSESSCIVERQSDPRLLSPSFSHDIIQNSDNSNFVVSGWIVLKELSENRRSKVLSAGRDCTRNKIMHFTGTSSPTGNKKNRRIRVNILWGLEDK